MKELDQKQLSNTDFEVRSLDVEQVEVKTPGNGNIKYLFAGILFGILLVKSEVVSWFRIQEMFRFQEFHMYGVIGSAIVVGATSVWGIRKLKLRAINGQPIRVYPKKVHLGNIFGGLLFGFGWALTGACPGPLFAQVGTGAIAMIIPLLSAVAGTWVYGFLRNKLPH